MTDMHREGFERATSNLGYYIGKWTLGGAYVKQETKDAYVIWQAAMRYRDEQARCECAYTCKFCRDEQEKQA